MDYRTLSASDVASMAYDALRDRELRHAQATVAIAAFPTNTDLAVALATAEEQVSGAQAWFDQRVGDAIEAGDVPDTLAPFVDAVTARLDTAGRKLAVPAQPAPVEQIAP